jgi:pimeloyl-ACP methyl ester carboxylesterase
VPAVPEPTPLVLLHPFPMDASFWGPVAPLLAAEREIVTPEFPGLGAAPAVDAPSVDWFADAVAGRIAGMRGGRAAVCGLSLGGYAALSLVARHPDRVAALVLADTRAEPDTAEAAEGRHRAAAQVRASGLAAFLDDFVPRLVAPGDEAARDAVRAIAEEQDPEAVARALEALAGRPDRLPDLPRIAVPTLVVVGSEDGLTPPSFSETLAAEIPDAELVVIEGSGHLTALERPQEFAAAVGAFLRASASP